MHYFLSDRITRAPLLLIMIWFLATRVFVHPSCTTESVSCPSILLLNLMNVSKIHATKRRKPLLIHAVHLKHIQSPFATGRESLFLRILMTFDVASSRSVATSLSHSAIEQLLKPFHYSDGNNPIFSLCSKNSSDKCSDLPTG